ncbi:hypothetical protein I9W82_004428 [Candida metapsilosis]|uniref:Uncharacterized protein n=1 Tax=Candida metapsilosis TaxID=273372 RepID=A0A8H8D9V7_9ASCO|nr:hypothetical protein I9W82_004428 [Candida metapsilosis]
MKPSHTLINNSTATAAGDDDEPDEWDRRIMDTGCHQENLKLQLCHADTGDWRKCLKEMQAFRASETNFAKKLRFAKSYKSSSSLVSSPYMSPTKQSSNAQAAAHPPKPQVPFKLTLYPPSLRPTQEEEEEISIELSTDEELDQDERYPQEASRDIEQLIEESSDKELFRAKLKQLEKDSLRRFENKWTGIISKYSNINDDRESDEIDLVTGEIVTNNGHLNRIRNGGESNNGKRTRRLTTFKLWKQQEGPQPDVTVRNRLQKLDDRAVKQRDRDMRRMRIPSPSKSDNKPSLTSGDFLRNVSPTKGQVPTGIEKDESPTKKRRVFVQQAAETSPSEYSETESDMSSDYSVDDGSEAENSVEEDDSYEDSDYEDRDEESNRDDDETSTVYEKKQSQDFSKSKYFKQMGSSILNAPRLASEGPLSTSTPEPELLPGTERKPNTTASQKSTNHRQSSKESFNDSDIGNISGQNLNSLFLEHSSPKLNKSHSILDFNKDSVNESSPFLDESSPINTPHKVKSTNLIEKGAPKSFTNASTNPTSLPSSASCESFEEQINIIEEPYYFMGDDALPTTSSSTLKIFKCCVTECTFCTMNKKLYASHLIKLHSSLLYQLGYPVEVDAQCHSSSTEVVKQITDMNKKRLFADFPLHFKRQLPTNIHKCDKLINGDQCQMFYLHGDDLNKHKQAGKCNSQSQIIFCPILGCGYMTDGGYQEWRSHLIDAGHSQVEQNKSKTLTAGDKSVDMDSSNVEDSIMKDESSPNDTQPTPTKRTLLLNNLKAMTSRSQDDRFAKNPTSQSQTDSGYESIEELFQ